MLREFLRFGGVCKAICVVLLFALGQCALVATDVWLSVWIDNGDQSQDWLFFVFLALVCAAVLTALARSLVFFSATLKASSNMHHTAFWAVLNAPLSFFTSNPLGTTFAVERPLYELLVFQAGL